MINLLLTPDSSRSLFSLSLGSWVSCWVQGGILDFVNPFEKSVYVVPSIVIKCSSIVQIGAVAVEQTDGSERFILSFNTLSDIGTDDSERLWRPPRMPIAVFPSDLNFLPFLESEIVGSLLIDENSGSQFIDGIIFERGTNTLLIASSCDLPESIIVTSREDYVERVLKGRVRIPMQREVDRGSVWKQPWKE